MRVLVRPQRNPEIEHADRCERLSKLSEVLDDAWARSWGAMAGQAYKNDQLYTVEAIQEVINYVDAFAYREGCPTGFTPANMAYRPELHRGPNS